MTFCATTARQRDLAKPVLTPEQAVEEQRKIKLPVTGSEQPTRELNHLPARLRELIEQSVKLQERVIRLDQMLGHETGSSGGDLDHPLKTQLSRLRAAYGKEAE